MFQKISKKTAQEILNNTESILVDIRDAESFEQGHLENAIHLTQDNLNSFVNETNKSIPILVMCYHGVSSQSVAAYLNQQGFTDVYSIDGGYEGWDN